MTGLEIRLFGRMSVSFEGTPLDAFPTERSRALFGFVVLNRGRAFSRSILAGTLWPVRSESAAKRCLRTELWRVRRVLDVGPRPLVISENGVVRFNREARHWVDVDRFLELVSGVDPHVSGTLTETELQRLTEAAELYRGDLLEDFDQEWCAYERERLKSLFLAVLRRLMQHHATGRRWELAIAWAQRHLQYDSTAEQVHVSIMRAYYAAGNRSAALHQYALCTRLLREELDVEPMQETRAIALAILNERELPDEAPGAAAGLRSGLVEELAGGIEAALHDLELVRVRLRRLLAEAERISAGR